MNEQEFNRTYEFITPKQKKVLWQFLEGKTDEEIAQNLNDITSSAVRHQIGKICIQFELKKYPDYSRCRQDLVEIFAKFKSELVSKELLKKYDLSAPTRSLPEAQNELEKTIDSDSNYYYIERLPLESVCYEILLHSGSLLRIKAPKLMGKTWLINRVLVRAKEQSFHPVRLDFRQTSRIDFTQLDRFLRWFCLNVGRQLGLPNQLDDYWDEENFGSQVSCTTYFEEYLLPQVNTSLALCLDHVDRIFPYPETAEDFLGLLRSWHDGASSRSIWKKLRLFLVHRELYPDLNINQSPFNVGRQIELSEFNQQQVSELLERHQLDWNSTQVDQLMDIVGGYPYLVQEALSHLKAHKNITLEEFLRIAPTEAGTYGDHLRQHWSNLQKFPELAVVFKEVITATNPIRIDPILASRLHSMGLVKLQGNDVIHSCRLYRKYFREQLGVD
ncbi:MAG: AAA-like domain-containing protein [Cyanobacteriota bacterium]